MKVLIVALGYPSERYKGLGIFEFDQAKALKKRGHEIIYMSLDLRSMRRKRKWGYEFFLKDGINICSINVPCGKIPDRIFESIGEKAFIKLYRKILKKYGQFDIIHAHFYNIAYIAKKALNRLEDKTIFIMTEHSSTINEKIFPKKVFKKAEFAYKNSNKVITVSNPLGKNIFKKFGIRTVTIPNIVDIERFKFEAKKKNESIELSNRTFTFISVGNLIPRKKFDLLVNVFNALLSVYPECHLIICGNGEEWKKIKKLLIELNIENKVTMLGNISREKINREMSKSDCFVLATELETFGVVYIEALVSGLPVIATRCGGPEDFITTQNGLLIPINDKDALLKAMIFMMKHKNNYNKESISEMAKNFFSPNIIANQLTKIYEDVINEFAKR